MRSDQLNVGQRLCMTTTLRKSEPWALRSKWTAARRFTSSPRQKPGSRAMHCASWNRSQPFRASSLSPPCRTCTLANMAPQAPPFWLTESTPQLVGTDIGCGMGALPARPRRPELEARKARGKLRVSMSRGRAMLADGSPAPGCPRAASTPHSAASAGATTSARCRRSTRSSRRTSPRRQGSTAMQRSCSCIPGRAGSARPFLRGTGKAAAQPLMPEVTRRTPTSLTTARRCDGPSSTGRSLRNVPVTRQVRGRARLRRTPQLYRSRRERQRRPEGIPAPEGRGSGGPRPRAGAGFARHAFLPRRAPGGAKPEALCSLAHGAGRKFDRGAMHGRAGTTKSELVRLARNPFGGIVVCEDRDLLVEEAPEAYKNIARVIEDLSTFGLARVVATFRPLVTFKTARRRDQPEKVARHRPRRAQGRMCDDAALDDQRARPRRMPDRACGRLGVIAREADCAGLASISQPSANPDGQGPASAIAALYGAAPPAELAQRWDGSIQWICTKPCAPAPQAQELVRRRRSLLPERDAAADRRSATGRRALRRLPRWRTGRPASEQDRKRRPGRACCRLGPAVVAREERSQHRNKAPALEAARGHACGTAGSRCGAGRNAIASKWPHTTASNAAGPCAALQALRSNRHKSVAARDARDQKRPRRPACPPASSQLHPRPWPRHF